MGSRIDALLLGYERGSNSQDNNALVPNVTQIRKTLGLTNMKSTTTGDIAVMISPKEIMTLRTHTNVSPFLLKRIQDAIDRAQKKRKNIARVKVMYTREELDNILHKIADKANERTSSPDVQYTLDNMFGRFAEKYNMTTIISARDQT